MDTLKRVGSLRLSKRSRKQRENDKKTSDEVQKTDVELLPPPKFYATLGRKDKNAKTFFTISFKDVVVTTLNGYQPTHLKAVFERHRRVRASEAVLWEPSLKCTSTGSGVWHPSFVIHLAITVPRLSKGESQTLRQKDAFISIENIDLKGKRKLLAKARLNLSDYFESAAETDVSFRLKLHPESSKVASASIELGIRRSVSDPTKQSLEPCMFDEDTCSLSDDRILNPSQKSLASSPMSGQDPVIAPIANGEDEDEPDEEQPSPAPSPTPPSPKSRPKPKIEEVVKPAPQKKIVPNIVSPPPLPPRQKVLSQDSPPPSSSQKDVLEMVTSTPLVAALEQPKASEGRSTPVFLSPTKPSKGQVSPRSKTPVKEIDWNNDEEDAENPPPSIGISLSACASPKVTKPSEQSKASADKELIEWAKSQLQHAKPQVKVTNLTSSWRNGLGFCLILHKSHPTLIPLKDLSVEHAKDNNEIAFDVADLLKLDTDLIRDMALEREVTDKTVVSEFLRQLQLRTWEDPAEAGAVIEFQKKWYKRNKYFKREVGQLCQAEEEEQRRKESQIQEPIEEPIKEPIEEPAKEDPEPVSNNSPPDEDCNRRQRAKRLIALAHQESSSSYDDSSQATAASVSESGLVASGTIMEELTQLGQEEEQISAELEKLELALRTQDEEETDESDFEALLQKYVSMVNEKSSLVRRQMQLNIAEKERAIEHKKEKLQRRLQKFSDLDESQKTEAMRLEEEALLQQYVEAVNEKNELVHDLDSQEKLIAEDERIRSFIVNRDSLTAAAGGGRGASADRHNLMNEFLDFFKSSK